MAHTALVVGKAYSNEEGKSLKYLGNGEFGNVSSEKAERSSGKLVVNGVCYTETDEIVIYVGKGKLKPRPPLKF